MKLSLALIASALFTASTMATPVGELQKRVDLTVVLCKDSGLGPGPTGGCTDVTTSNNGCANVPSGYNDNISSAAPLVESETHVFRCSLWENANCQGRSVLLTGPAYNLQDQNFNDITSSVKCYWV